MRRARLRKGRLLTPRPAAYLPQPPRRCTRPQPTAYFAQAGPPRFGNGAPWRRRPCPWPTWAPRGKNSGFIHFYAHFSRAAASRHAPRKRALHVSAAQRCGACPRERLPCRPPGRLRAGAPLQPASWPYRLSSLLSKLFPFIRAAAVGRSRPAESSTSLFDWASRAPQALRK